MMLMMMMVMTIYMNHVTLRVNSFITVVLLADKFHLDVKLNTVLVLSKLNCIQLHIQVKFNTVLVLSKLKK